MSEHIHRGLDRNLGDPYENLKIAVVEQAATDYVEALVYGNDYQAASLRRWFLSEEYQWFTEIDAAWMLRHLREKAMNRRKRRLI